MRIVQLTAENVKRLVAVDITPDENVQIISGKNAQGKTSVLDAIWLALGGRAASTETTRPIRDGSDSATVNLDLGDITVTRAWKGEKSTLTVASKDGAKFGSPQALLDSLVGRLSFDPLAFTRLSARDQVKALTDVVTIDVDLDEIASERAQVFESRTIVGREVKRLEGHVAALPSVDVDTPDEEVSVIAVQQELEKALAIHSEAVTCDQRAETLMRDIERYQQEIARLTAQMGEASAELESVTARRAAIVDLPDTDAIRERLASIDSTNAAVRRKHQREAAERDLEQAKRQQDDLTAQLVELDKMRDEALAAAAFPVEGLSFDEEGVTFQGVPFSQASSAEQIRVSLGIAMALNPKLRVLRLLDGSLLDQDSMDIIRQMAVDNDYQIWIERVSDGSGVGVEIEDGSVKA